MSDRTEPVERYRRMLNRGQLKQAGAMASRHARKNPFLWIGALAAGVAGVVAWRNRQKIAAAAGPVIADARTKGEALIDQAAAKSEVLIDQAAARGHVMIDEAKAKSAAMVAKARRVRRGVAPQIPPQEVH